MPYDFRTFSFRGCGCGNLPDVETDIRASVGQGGVNRSDDSVTIQSALNNIPIDQGGPQVRLAVDGIAGPLTISAIRKFQTRQLGWADGRIDPGGPTLARLRGYSANGNAGGTGGLKTHGGHRRAPSPQMFEVIRRGTAVSVLPHASHALRKTQLNLDLVMARLKVKGVQRMTEISPGESREPRRLWNIFNRHFSVANLSTPAATQSLSSVQQTFENMKAVLDGRPGIWGADIVEIDPITAYVKELDEAVAYTPTTTGDRARQTRLGIMPWRIYFTNLIDGQDFDHYLYTVLHELAHFVDNETQLHIGDIAYGYQPSILRLSHHQRMRNAECYSACAFEMAFGNDRLVGIYPLLRAIEIDDDVIIR